MHSCVSQWCGSHQNTSFLPQLNIRFTKQRNFNLRLLDPCMHALMNMMHVLPNTFHLSWTFSLWISDFRNYVSAAKPLAYEAQPSHTSSRTWASEPWNYCLIVGLISSDNFSIKMQIVCRSLLVVETRMLQRLELPGKKEGKKNPYINYKLCYAVSMVA